jgi:hypothetical protein
MEAKPLFEQARVIASPPTLGEQGDLVLWPKTSPIKLRGDASDQLIRGGANCHGWKVVQCVALLEGGSSPTLTLQPLEVIEYRIDGDGEKADMLIPVGSTTAALAHGAAFDVLIRGGRLHLRVDASTGTPTKATILIAGVERDLEALRVG